VRTIHCSLLPKQHEFIRCQDYVAAFVGGLGSGKTKAACIWTLKHAINYPRARRFIFSNTFPQLQSGTMVSFFAECDEWGLLYIDRIRTQKKVILPDLGATIEVWTAYNAELFRSLEIDHAWVDEAHEWKRADFEKLLGRMRGSKRTRHIYPDLRLQMRLTANPPHTLDHWLVDMCTTPNERTGKPLITLFTASTFDNYMLPTMYVDRLVDTMDPDLADIELRGQFGDIGRGRIWRRFERQKHVLSESQAAERGLSSLEFDPHVPVVWSNDFNVDPLCSILGQWRRVEVEGYQRIVFFVLDEIRVRDAIIDHAVKEFLNRDAAKIAIRSQLLLYGDAV